MAVISFRGVTIWDSAVNGVGWRFVPGVPVREAVDKRARLGDGSWSLGGPMGEVEHSLSIQWRTNSPATIEAMVRGLAGSVERGALVVPDFGTYQNCRLSAVGAMEPMKSDQATGWIISTTLTFTEYF
jgi:hypothetical protein